jgi:hypothetical protein
MFKPFFVILVIFPISLYSQIISELPTNELGAVYYNKVFKVDSVNKNELFLRSKTFFVNNFKYAKNVIQLEDKEAGVIIGKGYKNIVSNSEALISANCDVYFTIKILSKDNKFKVEVYDFYGNTKPSYPYFPNGIRIEMSTWFDTLEYYKSNGNPRPAKEKFKTAFIESVEGIFSVISNEMIKPSDIKSEDW